MIGPLR